jgi:hypothetical protein
LIYPGAEGHNIGQKESKMLNKDNIPVENAPQTIAIGGKVLTTIWEDEFKEQWPLKRIIQEGEKHGFQINGFQPGEGWKAVIVFPYAVLNGVYNKGNWGFYYAMTSERFILAQAQKELEELGKGELLPMLLRNVMPNLSEHWDKFFSDAEYLDDLRSLIMGNYGLASTGGRITFLRDLEDVNYHELVEALCEYWGINF